jgi:hypothetical protein
MEASCVDTDRIGPDRIGLIPQNGYDGESLYLGQTVGAGIGSLSCRAEERTVPATNNKMSGKEPKWVDPETEIMMTGTTQVRCGHCNADGGAAHAAQCTRGGKDYRQAVDAALKIHTDAGGAKSDFVPPPMETTGVYSAKEVQLIQTLQATAFKSGLKQVKDNRRKAAQEKKDQKFAEDLQRQEEANKKMKMTQPVAAPAMVTTFPQMQQGWTPYPYQMNMGYAGHPQAFPGMALNGPPFAFGTQMFPGMVAAPVAAASGAAGPGAAAPGAAAPGAAAPGAAASVAETQAAAKQRLKDELENAKTAYETARAKMRAGP